MTHLTITPGKPLPKGADAADFLASNWTKDQVVAWARERVRNYTPPAKPDQHHDDTPPVEAYDSEPSMEFNGDAKAEVDIDAPFQLLGHLDGDYFYLPETTRQIIHLSAAAHSKNALLALADIDYWAVRFPSQNGIGWTTAIARTMQACAKKGFFDPHTSIRGRGAWMDAGRPVLHMGEKVYVDGVPIAPTQVKSKYVYSASPSLEISQATPLESSEAHKLVDICESFSWENKLSGILLAGWLTIAPVCGMLRWRPHIYVTGPSSAGKSWITDNVVKPMLGKMCLHMALSSTEAGIRHKLKHDAMPVVFDEAESNTHQDAVRMQGILSLARGSSSGVDIYKGSADGKGISYPMRSCFYFSSINVSIIQRADESRISRLVIKQDMDEGHIERFREIKKAVITTITPEYSAKMFARIMANMKVLQANCETFKEAAVVVLNSNRSADQIGHLLAGVYLCHSTTEVTLAKAMEFLERNEWGDHTTINSKKDEERLLDRIATHRMRIQTDDGVADATVGELILIVGKGYSTPEDPCGKDTAERELARIGITVDTMGGCFYIANASDPMKKILYDTPWANEWGRPLRDFYHAEITPTVYFTPGIKCRATKLPLEVLA